MLTRNEARELCVDTQKICENVRRLIGEIIKETNGNRIMDDLVQIDSNLSEISSNIADLYFEGWTSK